jgi:glycosyltransferase involved in cell wall biosynthesis
MNVSVCMATYNGERYIAEQVASILPQLGENDEIVILDDASLDRTTGLLESLGDSRIKVYRNTHNLGHVQTFSKVISLATKPFILMADQDDVWLGGRVDAMCEALRGSVLVSSNSEFMDGEGNAIAPLHANLEPSESTRYASNIARIFSGKAFYDGCTMGFRAELRSVILPIPSYVESHDLWIAMAANIMRSNTHISCVTLRRRVHGGNASVGRRQLLSKLWSRWVFMRSFLELVLRLRKYSPQRA